MKKPLIISTPGPAGASGSKILNGTGDPSNGLTAGTAINDYYLDNATGNYWQREAYTGTVNATTVVLSGNVQWKRLAVLKGAAGTPGTKTLNGNSGPAIGLTAQSSVGDYYLNSSDGKLWQRFQLGSVALDGEFVQFTGNVVWKVVANLTGPAGANIQALSQTEISAMVAADGTLVYNTTTGNIQQKVSGGWATLLKAVGRLVLGGTDNLIDRVQVDGSIKASVDVKAGNAYLLGETVITRILDSSLLHYAPSGSHVFYSNLDTVAFVMRQNGCYISKGLTTEEINAIPNPSNGDRCYNKTLNTICFYNGTSWQKVTSTAM